MTEENAAPPPYPVCAEHKSTGRSAWFWIIALSGCFLLLFVIAAVALPSMLSVKMRANEDSAIETMHNINSAELAYESAYPDIGFACPLSVLGGDPRSGAPPTAQAAQLIEPVIASTGQKAGYDFTVTCGEKVTIKNHDTYLSYNVTAVPQSVGKTGNRGFCSKEDNIIKADPTGGTNCTQPVQ